MTGYGFKTFPKKSKYIFAVGAIYNLIFLYIENTRHATGSLDALDFLRN
tara:strand:+ start:111 stop:257 length:147 start_codon:yes stop_codon:yes gene_type:complete